MLRIKSMLNFIKIHWFGLILSIVVIFYAAVFVVVFLSPRQDELKRGFIPCTEVLVKDMFDCNGKAWCMSKAIVKNTGCDTKIVLEGITSWVKGKQPTPWANYLFEPEMGKEQNEGEIHPELEEFYRDNRDIKADMEELDKKWQELEKSLADDKITEVPVKKQEVEESKEEVKDEKPAEE